MNTGDSMHQRKQQNCSFCKNHNIIQAKKDHKNKCTYDNLEHIELCRDGCKVTKERQRTVAIEKRAAYKLKVQLAKNLHDGSFKRAEYECRKCRNHKIQNSLKNQHTKICQFANCECDLCKLTQKRRNAVKKDVKNHRLISQEQLPTFSATNSPDSGIGSPSNLIDFNITPSSIDFVSDMAPALNITDLNDNNNDSFFEKVNEFIFNNIGEDTISFLYNELEKNFEVSYIRISK